MFECFKSKFKHLPLFPYFIDELHSAKLNALNLSESYAE